jgi:TrmH family RNA methyltransferase
MPKKVTSAANATVKLLAGLRLRKYREESGLFLAEGVRTAMEALEAGAAPKIVAYAPQVAPREVKALADACAGAGSACIEVSEKILAKIARKDNPQPLIAAYARVIRSFAEIRPAAAGLFVALDRVRDPGNLGAVIRTSDAVGAAGVILVGDCCDPHAPDCVRAAMGSIFRVPVYVGDEAQFLALAARWPGTVAGASQKSRQHYRAARYKWPVLAVLGSEQSGLSPAIERACAMTVGIPIPGKAESLNLAVAAGILLYGVRESGDRA